MGSEMCIRDSSNSYSNIVHQESFSPAVQGPPEVLIVIFGVFRSIYATVYINKERDVMKSRRHVIYYSSHTLQYT